jgi:hypothetical protein
MKKPWYQSAIQSVVIIKYIPWILVGLGIVGSILDTLSSSEWITPSVTYIGTIVIVVGVILIQIALKRSPAKWITDGDQVLRISSLGIKQLFIMAGIIVALWIPRLLPKAEKPPEFSPGTDVSPPITSIVPTPNVTSIKTPKILFEDKFDQLGLQSEWQWVDPANDSNYELNTTKGSLKLSTNSQNHNLYEVDNYNAPRLMLPTAYDNFAITTHVEIPPGINYQGAGLLFWQDEYNYVRLEYAHGYNRTGPHIWSRTNGESQAPGDERNDPNSSYLNMIRTGTTVRTFFSNNGTDWNQIGEVVYIRSDLPIWVGLVLVNGTEGIAWSADFDFFIMEEP